MLRMVIEHFKDVAAISERFKTRGQMLPDGVIYQSSWIDAAHDRCFQLMEVPQQDALRAWISAWSDVVEFEIVAVTSAEFWATRES